MGRTKTVVKIPIQHTRCWSCTHLEQTIGEDADTGKIVNRYLCPKNMSLPERVPPYFAEKCELYKPKKEG